MQCKIHIHTQNNICILIYYLNSITSWWLVFTILFVFGGFYMISRLDGPLTIAGTALSPSTLYTSYAAVSLFLLIFSGATGAIFWIIGKLKERERESFFFFAIKY